MNQIYSFGVLALCLLTCSSLVAQEDEPTQKQMRAKLAGTWTLDMQKSKEHLDAEIFARIPKDLPEVAMVFGEDNVLKMKRGEAEMQVTYFLTGVENSETDSTNYSQYNCQMEINGQKSESLIVFLDENTIKLTGAGAPPAVLSRPVRQYSLAEAKALLMGDWVTDVEATKSMTEEWGDNVREFSLSLGESGTFEAKQQGEPESGTYAVNSPMQDDEVTIDSNQFELVTEVGEEKRSMDIRILESDRISIHFSEKLFVVLDRKKQ